MPDLNYFIPFFIYVGGALFILAVMYGLSHVLGQRHTDRETNEVYESGIPTTGTARVRFSVSFYLVAMLFVIFDLEVVFLFAWAIGATEVGWVGYAGLLAFVVILTVGLIYEWRMGALDWLQREMHTLRNTGGRRQ